MQLHIGVKMIQAKPMTRQAYNEYRGWTLPADKDGTDAGFLVEYMDGGQANHPDHDGYISWSPADVFARAYRPTESMPFGLAIEMLKMGLKVTRKGWNGKGMWLAMQAGTKLDRIKARSGAVVHRAAELQDGEQVTILPHIDMRAADGSIVVGWLASQTDMLAEDWQIVD